MDPDGVASARGSRCRSTRSGAAPAPVRAARRAPRARANGRRSPRRGGACDGGRRRSALLPTTSMSLRLAPRAGTAIVTCEPRRPDSQVFQDRAIGGLGRNEDARRHVLALHVELPEERRHELGAVEVFDAIDDPALPPEDPSPSNREHLERRLEVVLGEAHHVQVLRADQDHLLALERAACRLQLVAEPCRLLVLLAIGRLGHLRVEPLQDGLRVPREEVPERLHVSSIGLLGDPRLLRARTARSSGRCRSRGTVDPPGPAGRRSGWCRSGSGRPASSHRACPGSPRRARRARSTGPSSAWCPAGPGRAATSPPPSAPDRDRTCRRGTGC